MVQNRKDSMGAGVYLRVPITTPVLSSRRCACGCLLKEIYEGGKEGIGSMERKDCGAEKESNESKDAEETEEESDCRDAIYRIS